MGCADQAGGGAARLVADATQDDALEAVAQLDEAAGDRDALVGIRGEVDRDRIAGDAHGAVERAGGERGLVGAAAKRSRERPPQRGRGVRAGVAQGGDPGAAREQRERVEDRGAGAERQAAGLGDRRDLGGARP
ncbi:MAG: hypothetical protein E6J90_42675, partial [Deltaproteobacteria bacterium]